MNERRQRPRQKSFLRGCLYFNNRRASAACLIRNITPGGARVLISHPLNIPDIVELYVAQKGKTIRAHVEWRRGDELGLSFAHETDEANASAEFKGLLARLSHLEIEVASLRHTIKELSDDTAPEMFDGGLGQRREVTPPLVSLASGIRKD
jgi:hypothetical protein